MTSLCLPITLANLSLDCNTTKYLKLAEELARKAALGEKCGERYGAVIVKDGYPIAEGYDSSKMDPTRTAGINAIRQACQFLKTPDLCECVMYLNGFPTLIDSFAISNANIRHVYYVDKTKTSSTVVNRTTYHPIDV